MPRELIAPTSSLRSKLCRNIFGSPLPRAESWHLLEKLFILTSGFGRERVAILPLADVVKREAEFSLFALCDQTRQHSLEHPAHSISIAVPLKLLFTTWCRSRVCMNRPPE